MSLSFRDSLDSFCTLTATTAKGAKPSGTSADIYLYGVIGGNKVNAHTVQQAISKAVDIDVLNVHLNTFGGTFADGLAIYNTLKLQNVYVVVRVMGYALSMGSLIMLAADEVQCAENGLIMIHKAQGLTFGSVDDHHKTIEILNKHDAVMCPDYLSRMGITEQELTELLSAETWYTAAEAKKAGLVDTVINAVKINEEEANAGAGGVDIMASYRDRSRLPEKFRRGLFAS